MKVDESLKLKQVKFDNLYDILFTHQGQPKQNLTKTLTLNGDRLDFLDVSGKNLAIQNSESDKKAIEVDKLKISKTFKLVNPVPKFQSVPATPQFFDLAAAHL